MPPKPSGSQRSTHSKPKGAASRVSTLRLDLGPPIKKQKLQPLSFIARPPVFILDDSQPGSASQSRPLSQPNRVQERAKGSSTHNRTPKLQDTAPQTELWVDQYSPETEEDLAVHKRKVQDVRQWFLDAFDGRLRKYRRILVLTGPAGTAKTATVRVLSRELGFDVLEWRNSADERFDHTNNDDVDRVEYEGHSEKFRKFFTRATSCNSIFGNTQPLSQASQSIRSSSQPAPSRTTPKRQIILLEDLPNILHSGTQEAFHETLKNLAREGAPSVSPVVIIISDAGLRGEDAEEGTSSGWKGKAREAVDVRSVIPSSVLTSIYVTQIAFNPIAPTLMKRALQQLLDANFRAHPGTRPSRDVLDVIIESSNGDIRSAIMALQFACISPGSSSKSVGKHKGKKGVEARVMLEAITRREQTLALFHLVGKVLYNKRKGDAPSSSASAKDIQRDRDIDRKLLDPPKLPPHLIEHERRPSRVDVETLYADSPIDASLLSLYIHQNYVQYCETLEECDGVMDWMSWVDSNGGESWLQANPHRFHLVTLGTMHSLPTPVPRRSQKSYKPEFFATLSQGREAEDALKDVHEWLRQQPDIASGWTRTDVATDLGAILRIRESTADLRPPLGHRLFSRMEFVRNSSNRAELADDNDLTQEDRMLHEDGTGLKAPVMVQSEADRGGWLESDDIEDF